MDEGRNSDQAHGCASTRMPFKKTGHMTEAFRLHAGLILLFVGLTFYVLPAADIDVAKNDARPARRLSVASGVLSTTTTVMTFVIRQPR